MATINKTMRANVSTHRPGLRLIWLALQTWATRRKQRKTLARLDDHMLRDIGLTRGHAMQECAKPFWAE